MSDDDLAVPLSDLDPERKAERSGSFGAVASHYDRYRPGPSDAAVAWLLPEGATAVVDLGAGTGALSRILVGRVPRVVAVEPDDRMRAVYAEEVEGAEAVAGTGESMPLPDSTFDAVLASSSWHWMDVVPALGEVARVLVPGGVLGAMWSGPDPDSDFIRQARTMLAGRAGDAGAGETGDVISLAVGDGRRPDSTLVIPEGVSFDQPERRDFRWTMAMTADELVGLLGTFSWIITMEPAGRERVLSEARRLLAELLGVEGDVTVDVDFRTAAYRARRHG